MRGKNNYFILKIEYRIDIDLLLCYIKNYKKREFPRIIFKTIITFSIIIIMELSTRQLNLQMPSIPFHLIFYSGSFQIRSFHSFIDSFLYEKIRIRFAYICWVNCISRFIAHFYSAFRFSFRLHIYI